MIPLTQPQVRSYAGRTSVRYPEPAEKRRSGRPNGIECLPGCPPGGGKT